MPLFAVRVVRSAEIDKAVEVEADTEEDARVKALRSPALEKQDGWGIWAFTVNRAVVVEVDNTEEMPASHATINQEDETQ